MDVLKENYVPITAISDTLIYLLLGLGRFSVSSSST
jgi:hypothetical protein